MLACLLTCTLLIVLPIGGSLLINYYILFFWTGYFLKKYAACYQRHLRLISVLALLVFCFLVSMGYAHVVNKLTWQQFTHQSLYVLTEYILGLSGSFTLIGICYMLSSFLDKSTCVRHLSSIGRYTLGIYIVQIFLLERFAVHIAIQGTTALSGFAAHFYLPLLGIAFMEFSYQVVRISSHFEFINTLLYGGMYRSKSPASPHTTLHNT